MWFSALLIPWRDSTRVYVDSLQQPGDYHVSKNKWHNSGGSYFWQYQTDSGCVMMEVNDGKPGPVLPMPAGDSGKFRFITSVFQNLVTTEFEPIEARLDSVNVDSIIAVTLHDNGIDLEYAYGVLTDADDSLHVAEPGIYAEAIRQSDYRVRLFPQDVFADRASLALYFPRTRRLSLGADGTVLRGHRRPDAGDHRVFRLHDSDHPAYVRARSGFNTSDRVVLPLSESVRELCDRAIEKARAEGRKTVLDRDFD